MHSSDVNGGSVIREPNIRAVFNAIHQHQLPYLALSARSVGRSAVEVGGHGSRVEMSDGRQLLDFGSYAVTLLGHGYPSVAAAVHRQLDSMPTATRLMANPATAAAASALVGYLGGGLKRVYFGLNGADVVEAAIKLARAATGRTRILAVEGGFHGKSLGALALTHHERFRQGSAGLLAGVTHVPADDPDAVARECAAGDVAALVFEPIQGENGVVPLEPPLLQAWCSAAAEAGAFVIADEIQTGLGRCGERSLALAEGLPVDAVLLGKPLGGGIVPVSALVCTDRLYGPLFKDPMMHTATFAGHPLSCSAVPAALEAIDEYTERGRVIAATMETGLAGIQKENADLVTAVRGRGLLWGLDLSPAEKSGRMIAELAHAGLLVSPCMSRPGTLRLLPPLVADDADLAEALEILADTLARVDRTKTQR